VAAVGCGLLLTRQTGLVNSGKFPPAEVLNLFLPPPDTQSNDPSSRGPGGPDLAVLFFLTLFAVVAAWFGYTPPPFKPRWAYVLMQCGACAIWVGAGVALVIFGEWITGVIVILLAIVSLGIVLAKGEKGPGDSR
jgi:hypothetical protein